jgi:hypothetical protein
VPDGFTLADYGKEGRRSRSRSDLAATPAPAPPEPAPAPAPAPEPRPRRLPPGAGLGLPADVPRPPASCQAGPIVPAAADRLRREYLLVANNATRGLGTLHLADKTRSQPGDGLLGASPVSFSRRRCPRVPHGGGDYLRAAGSGGGGTTRAAAWRGPLAPPVPPLPRVPQDYPTITIDTGAYAVPLGRRGRAIDVGTAQGAGTVTFQGDFLHIERVDATSDADIEKLANAVESRLAGQQVSAFRIALSGGIVPGRKF